MKFAAILFWWQHRRILKAKGYSLSRFCSLSAAYWEHFAQDLTKRRKESAVTGSDDFCRQQLRVRW